MTNGARSVPPSYLCFAGQDWWTHGRAHSDFQLLVEVARTRKVLVINSIGMRMPLPGRSTKFATRIARKVRSTMRGLTYPDPARPDFALYSPVILPFYGSPFLRWINAWIVAIQVRFLCRHLGIERPITIVTVPTALDVVRHVPHRGLFYYRADDAAAAEDVDGDFVHQLERQLFEQVSRVIYVSRALMASEADETAAKATLIDHGVDTDHFAPDSTRVVPPDLAALPKPWIGFFGTIENMSVDIELLGQVAESNPTASLVLIGKTAADVSRLEKLPNVHLLGPRDYEDLPAYAQFFDVALLPRPDSKWTRAANPIKLKEYLALGLPVVSTRFPEVEFYASVVRVAPSSREFVEAVTETLAHGGLVDAGACRRFVEASTWANKAAQLMALCEAPAR